jgi:hypothetical protein
MIIFIFVFIIIIALIVVVIYIGNGNSKDNKKFTFQYKHNKHNKHNNHNYSILFPYISNNHTPVAPNEQQYQYPLIAPNEQGSRYPPIAPNEQGSRYPPIAPNEQGSRYPPIAPNEQGSRYPPIAPIPQPPKVSNEEVPMEKVSNEKVPISEEKKTESNIHNCEANYTWNKYLKKCITTECPIETYENCKQKLWTLPNSMALQLPYFDPRYPTSTSKIYCSQFHVVPPELQEQICEYLNIPVPEEDQTCWSECQNRCVKQECPEMTIEECTSTYDGGFNYDNPIYLQPYGNGETCEDLSILTPEFQFAINNPDNANYKVNYENAILPGEICWSKACNKCVKPYVKPLTREQAHIKHNFNPKCFPNNQTCERDVKFDALLYSPLFRPGFNLDGAIPIPFRKPSSETCEVWSTFTEWSEYGLNPVVLPGEVCYNQCTGRCVAPIYW